MFGHENPHGPKREVQPAVPDVQPLRIPSSSTQGPVGRPPSPTHVVFHLLVVREAPRQGFSESLLRLWSSVSLELRQSVSGHPPVGSAGCGAVRGGERGFEDRGHLGDFGLIGIWSPHWVKPWNWAKPWNWGRYLGCMKQIQVVRKATRPELDVLTSKT